MINRNPKMKSLHRTLKIFIHPIMTSLSIPFLKPIWIIRFRFRSNTKETQFRKLTRKIIHWWHQWRHRITHQRHHRNRKWNRKPKLNRKLLKLLQKLKLNQKSSKFRQRNFSKYYYAIFSKIYYVIFLRKLLRNTIEKRWKPSTASENIVIADSKPKETTVQATVETVQAIIEAETGSDESSNVPPQLTETPGVKEIISSSRERLPTNEPEAVQDGNQGTPDEDEQKNSEAIGALYFSTILFLTFLLFFQILFETFFINL